MLQIIKEVTAMSVKFIIAVLIPAYGLVDCCLYYGYFSFLFLNDTNLYA